MNDITLTVFTPTYNRSTILSRCYESLVGQTSYDFIWQIIDDGSTDDTESIVREWIGEDLIKIEYHKKENGGKASAINRSLELAHTPLWLCLDSDDYLTGDSVLEITSMFTSIESDESVCGLFSLRASPSGDPMQGVSIPESINYVTQGFVRYNLGIPPEYAHVFKTEIIRRFKYPEIKDERYFPLSFVYDQIDREYCYFVSHKPFMICEYQEDGITFNKRDLIKNNPLGYMLYKRQLIGFAPSLKEKAKAASTYVAACLLAKRWNVFRNNPCKFITLVCFPVGVLDFLIRYKFNIKIDLE